VGCQASLSLHAKEVCDWIPKSNWDQEDDFLTGAILADKKDKVW
jgi:hypothetical protein